MSSKNVESTVVSLGCPRNMLKSTLVLLGCPRKMVNKQMEKQCFHLILEDNRTTGTDTPEDEQEEQQDQNFLTTALAPESYCLSLAHTASPRLARSHAHRNETKQFPGWLTPPVSNLCISEVRGVSSLWPQPGNRSVSFVLASGRAGGRSICIPIG